MKDTSNVTEVGLPKLHENAAIPAVSGAMQRLLTGVGAISGRGPAPVHLWNPPYCGEIDMRIARDGTWHYNGSPINRLAMVKLFSTILRKDSERFVLVTPVERVGITVEDAPFLAVEMDCEPAGAHERLVIRTNVDDIIEISREHPIRFETGADGGLKPYIHVRGDLWALASRALTHELVARAGFETLVEQPIHGAEQGCSGADREMFGLYSGDDFFVIAAPDSVRDFA